MSKNTLTRNTAGFVALIVVAVIIVAAGVAALLLVPTVANAASITSASTAADGDDATGVSIRLLPDPAADPSDPRAATRVLAKLAPGASASRQVEVQNTSTVERNVSVYAGAATVGDGAFVAGEQGAENELTGWMTFSPAEVELAPGESAEVDVSIDVPADAFEGEHYAAMWAEVRSDMNTDTNVITANRVGTRVYVTVGAGNGAAPDFTIDSLTASRGTAGEPIVAADVTNIGGGAIDLTGALTLTDGPGGLSVGPVDALTGTTLAPGESGSVTIVLDPELPDGPWTASLTLATGLVTHDSVAPVTFPDAGVGETTEASEASAISLPVIIAIAVAAVIAIVALTFWLRHRRIAYARGRG